MRSRLPSTSSSSTAERAADVRPYSDPQFPFAPAYGPCERSNSGRARSIVSILTRSCDRVQLVLKLGWRVADWFQSSPGLTTGCNLSGLREP